MCLFLLKDNQEEDIQVSRQAAAWCIIFTSRELEEEDPSVCMLQPWSRVPAKISDPKEFL
jgi:hypothetical protein